jgi:hypothetical protein
MFLINLSVMSRIGAAAPASRLVISLIADFPESRTVRQGQTDPPSVKHRHHCLKLAVIILTRQAQAVLPVLLSDDFDISRMTIDQAIRVRTH